MADSNTIPRKLDGADVLLFAKTDGTGFTQCGEERWTIVAVAIAQYSGSEKIYVFSLDRDYEVIGDVDCNSVTDAMELVQTWHGVKEHEWLRVA